MLHSNIHGNLGKMTADQIVQCGRAVHLYFLRVCVPFHRQKRNVQSSPKFQKKNNNKSWLSTGNQEYNIQQFIKNTQYKCTDAYPTKHFQIIHSMIFKKRNTLQEKNIIVVSYLFTTRRKKIKLPTRNLRCMYQPAIFAIVHTNNMRKTNEHRLQNLWTMKISPGGRQQMFFHNLSGYLSGRNISS